MIQHSNNTISHICESFFKSLKIRSFNTTAAFTLILYTNTILHHLPFLRLLWNLFSKHTNARLSRGAIVPITCSLVVCCFPSRCRNYSSMTLISFFSLFVAFTFFNQFNCSLFCRISFFVHEHSFLFETRLWLSCMLYSLACFVYLNPYIYARILFLITK